MNTAIYSKSGNYAGVGFAIPVDDINRFIPQIIRTGDVERVGLGVQLLADEIYSNYAGRDGLPTKGALVFDVFPGSAAEEAGLRPTRQTTEDVAWGDVIVAIDGERIESAQLVFNILSQHVAGDVVTITVVRDGERLELSATLRLLPTAEG
jgi:S1-C subfamily serine protease